MNISFKRALKVLWVKVCLVSLFLLHCTTFRAQDIEYITIYPKDNQNGLNNPNMGWYYYKYDNCLEKYGTRFPDNETFDYWPGMTTAYYRIAWGHIEPKKGEFHWELIDNSAKYWIAAGKQICFRLTALEGYDGATPEWVKCGYEPDNPIFLEALDHFLGEFAKRYDGKEYVAYIDVGSIGIWGEGHHDCPDEVRIKHIDLYLKHFKNSLLVVSDDMGPDVCAYARSKGISIRDDSVMWHEKIFPTQVSYDLYWPTMPTIIETCHYDNIKGKKNPWAKTYPTWSDIALLATIEEYHASWVSVHGWADDFWKERQKCIHEANLRIGYRLQLVKAKWPKAVTVGNQVVFDLDWRNAAVAPCYKGGYVSISLLDYEGNEVCQGINIRFNVKDLKPGPNARLGEIQNCMVVLTIPMNLLPKEYRVYVSVGDRNGSPVYQLPYDESNGNKKYYLGNIAIIN